MAERAYVRDGAEIYRRSFAIIRAESDLARFNAAEEPVAVRIIHACGMPEIARDIVMSKSFAERARQALKDGAPYFAIPGWWPTASPAHACRPATTSCAPWTIPRCRLSPSASTIRAVRRRWSCGVIGWPARSSPSATRRRRLFRLLEMLDEGAPSPAAVIGLPVGFVGAMESKEALAAHGARAVPDRARPQGRQRHGGGGRQRAGERAGMSVLDSLAGTATAGTLYGIGVGPGDARYLTLRAAGLVQAVDVVAYFAKIGSPGNARRIVAPLLVEGRAEMRLEYPVTDEVPADSLEYQQKIGAFYRQTADALASLAATR